LKPVLAVPGHEVVKLLIPFGRDVLRLSYLAVNKRDHALVEVHETVTQSLLEDQQGMIIDHCVAQRAIGIDLAQLVK
jgi:hypothetical protein